MQVLKKIQWPLQIKAPQMANIFQKNMKKVGQVLLKVFSNSSDYYLQNYLVVTKNQSIFILKLMKNFTGP